MKTILKNWNLFRLIRLILGLAVLAQGISGGEYLLASAGGLFTIMALANVGCCGSGGCAVDFNKKSFKQEKEVVYEEVDRVK